MGVEDDPSKIAFVLKLRIREGVPDDVILRFANVQHMRFMIFNAFAGGMYMEKLNEFMSCVTIDYKIKEGHFYLVLLIDDETFKYRVDNEPETYFHWKNLLLSLPKPASV